MTEEQIEDSEPEDETEEPESPEGGLELSPLVEGGPRTQGGARLRGPINPRMALRPQNRNPARRADGTFGSSERTTPRRKPTRYKLSLKEQKQAEHRKRLIRLVELKLDPRVTMADIIKEFQVSRRVIENWVGSEEFQQLYQEIREGYLNYGKHQLRSLLHESFSVARELLHANSEHVRYEVVSKIWDLAGLGKEDQPGREGDDRAALQQLLELQQRLSPQVQVNVLGGQVVPAAPVISLGPEAVRELAPLTSVPEAGDLV